MSLYSKELCEALDYGTNQDTYLREKMKPKWFELTVTAKKLIQNKDSKSITQAEKFLSKALKLASKEPVASASTCHDLGVLHFSYRTKLPGGTYYNLQKAIQYFNRAISTEQRQNIPEKFASSLSQKATAYRIAANEYLWPKDDIDCLEYAKSLHTQAIDLLEKSDIPQVIKNSQLSIIYFNIASVLFDQGVTLEACIAQAKSVELYLALPYLFMNVMPKKQAIGLSFARLKYFSKIKEHDALCERIVKVAPSYGLDFIDMILINPLIDLAKPEEKIAYIVKRAELEPSKDNVNKLIKKQFELMENRRTCKTDDESDYLASLAQRVCSGLARILVSKKDSINALRFLENCSALRFCESANRYWQVPSEKLGLALWDDLHRLGSIYYHLNEQALMLEHVNKVGIKPLIEEAYEIAIDSLSVDKVSDYTSFYDPKHYPIILRSVLNDKDPINCLRQKASNCLDDFLEIKNTIDRLDPDFFERKKSDNTIGINHFESALRKHPELTLVRIDIELGYNDALIMVVELLNNKLVVTGHNVHIPEELIDQIGQFIKGEIAKPDKWPLDFIDWRKILPADCKRIGLLTSFFASQIPWIATGLKGEELLIMVEEVNFLPSILYLCNHVTHFNQRRGSKCINGGNTRFHNIANRHVSELISAVSKNDFLTAVKESERLSYYGHCTHESPNRPSLKTMHFELNDLALVNEIAGIELIEFWACQSGSNIPLSIFAIPVNEAFGFDMRVIEWGAVSSIGSLWALPELVTAHIKACYDQFVNNGMLPSKALLSAQRWWVLEGAEAEINKIKIFGLASYLNTLCCNENIDTLLGPMKVTTNSLLDNDLKYVEDLFLHPKSWSGLRFCGLTDKTKKVVLKEKLELTDYEKNKLKKQLDKLKLKSGFIKYV
ncbi:hypothetical protein [Photobacterium phosphoreum]|uniref:hypothetical protein n=1 Tax=Photobacterium phosphoreum TaxID=659 RepID=UPI000D15A6EF|nr:hypothetical protein [Photobacterium phosphoreum]PTB32356.1 hypothetical protein DAT36_11840 [Photobacterium phosphoreum]